MPGEDIEAVLRAARTFQPKGIATVLTYLGENVNDRTEARQVTVHYCELLDRIGSAALDSELSVKLTQLGHDISTELSYVNVKAIAEHALKLQNFVWIDMEDSQYTDSTLQVYRRLRAVQPNVGVCLQAYLYRTARDLDSLLPLSPAIRLVKGAYNEPGDRAFPIKKDVDANFLALATRMIESLGKNGLRPAFATHDQRLIDLIRQAAEARRVARDLYEFQMLYGIRTGAMDGLVGSGYRGRVLISYGPAWYPWYMRRLAERPANMLFVLRNLFGA
jgi:proline dehydrogenase